MNGDLISRSALLADGIRFSRGINDNGLLFVPMRDVFTSIEEAPAVDAVPGVRCKDCRHFGGHGACHYFAADVSGTPIFVRDNDFCSRGERREENA